MTTISSLASAAALSGTEPLPVDQSGATVKATVNQVKTYVNTSPAITGGSINSTPIGATTPSSGAFTSLSVNAAVANGAWAANTAIGNYTASSGAFSSATDYCIAHYTVANSDNTTGGVKFGSVASGSYTADFVVAPRVGGIYIEKLRLSSIGLAVTGNISSTARTLVGTTTDDGVNALQVNGSVKASGISTLNGLKVAAASGLPTLSIDNSTDTGNVDFATGGSVRFRIGYSGTTLVLSSPFSSKTIFTGDRDSGLLTVGNGLAVTGNISSSGTITPQQATTAGAPAYVKGAIYFDTTLNKLRVGGATAWETITSI